MIEESIETQEATMVDMIASSVAAFEREVPDWKEMPPSTLLMFLEDNMLETREWAFKVHSTKHAEEWRERVQQYMELYPRIKETAGIAEAPEVADEFGKYVLTLVGATIGLISNGLGFVGDGEIDADGAAALWKLLLSDPEVYPDVDEWGDQSFTWIVMKMEDQLREVRPSVLDYECGKVSGEHVSQQLVPLLILGLSVLLLLSLEHHLGKQEATEGANQEAN